MNSLLLKMFRIQQNVEYQYCKSFPRQIWCYLGTLDDYIIKTENTEIIDPIPKLTYSNYILPLNISRDLNNLQTVKLFFFSFVGIASIFL